MARKTLKKVSNLKTQGHDGIYGFCVKKFNSIHDRLAFETNKCFEETNISERMTKSKTTPIGKDLWKNPQ